MKKNSVTNYARALFAVSQDSKDADSTEVVGSLVTLLKKKNALGKLPKILTEFEKIAARKAGIVKLSVASARALSIESKGKISAIFGGKTEIVETIDTSLIGGVIVRTENTIFDGSVKKQLERLKMQLSN